MLKVCYAKKNVSSRHLWRVAMGNASSSLLGKNAPLERFLNPRLRVPFAKEKRQGKNPVFFFGALKGTRTPDLLVRSQSLYPAELAALIVAILFKPPRNYITLILKNQYIF